jgi:hypothetical protein
MMISATDTSKNVKTVCTPALFANFNQGSIFKIGKPENTATSAADTRLGKFNERPKVTALVRDGPQ